MQGLHAFRGVRGGGGKATSPLDVISLADLGPGPDPLVDEGPLAPDDCMIAGTFCLLREIELAAARYGHLTVGKDRRSVTWLLPTSKTDPQAVPQLGLHLQCTKHVQGLPCVCAGTTTGEGGRGCQSVQARTRLDPFAPNAGRCRSR